MISLFPRPTAFRRYAAFVGALGALLSSIHAQTAPAPTTAVTTPASDVKDGAIVLTPFEVSTQKDRGYAAGNTLSGGRIDTPLDLSPVSIQVMTKEFMDDFGIADMQDAAQWTMNVDLPNFGGDGPFGGNRNEFNIRGAGVGGAYPIRDGVTQFFVADGYNSERFEVVSGPNAGQAGSGNSGGLVSSSSKRLRYNSVTRSVRTRLDSFGGYRGEVDFNVGKDRFGVRVNALHQNVKNVQKGVELKQNAITLRAELKVAPKTNLSFQFERSGEWNNQYRRTYTDQQNLWDRTTVNQNNSVIATTAAAGISVISATTDRLVYNFATKSLINYRSATQYQTNGLGYNIPWGGNPNIPTEWAGGANMLKGFDKKFWLGPADDFADRDLNARTLALDHSFSPDWTARLTWSGSDTDNDTYWGDFSAPTQYRIDINKLLPDGTPNPKFMKAYSEWGGGGSQYQQNTNRDYVAEMTYRFSAPRFFDLHQSFTGIYSYRSGPYEAWSRTWRRNNNPAQLDPLNSVNALNLRTYYDDPKPLMQPIITQAALNAMMPGTTWGNYGSAGWHADNTSKTNSWAIFSTTSFFRERLVISGNYKADYLRNRNKGGISINGSNSDPNNNYKRYVGALNPATGLNEDGYATIVNNDIGSKAYGVVGTPFPASWARDGNLVQRWLSPIKLVWNYSENNRATGAGLFYTGAEPKAPFATTTDYAVRYSIPGGKAYFEFRRYFTENLGNLGTMANGTQIQDIWINLGYTDPAKTAFASNQYRDTSDRDLSGTEATFTANPTANWTMSANYGHPRVQTVNERFYLRQYLAENLKEWQAGAALPDGAIVPGTKRQIVSQSAIQTAISQIEDGLNGLTSGTIGNGPLHRGSINSRYAFREGTLRGLALTGGVSWRGSAKVGSRDPRLKFQTTAATITTAQTVAAAYDYLYVPSQLTNNVGANYTRRFGKYQARIQLNITNILNRDTPDWSGYSVINAGQMTNQSSTTALAVAGSNPRMQVLTGFQNPEPRKFVFTTTVDF